MNLPAKLRSVLEHRRLPLLAAGLAFALTLPALGSGLQFDDLFHRVALLGRPGAEGMEVPGHLFDFVNGDSARTRRLMDAGASPWWTTEDLHAAFWRPVTEVTHRIDYALWPNRPALMHLQSLLWYGALAAAAAVLYRKLLGASWVCGLAALLYALDDAHGSDAAWLANRNSVLAALFGVLALIAHDGWRRGGRKLGAVAGPLALGIALLSAEGAIATGAYLASYCVFLDRGPWRTRAASLIPYGVVTAVWWLLHHRLGFVIRGTGLYFDPGSEPLAFAGALVERAPIMLLAQWASFPASVHIFLTQPAARALWVAAVAALFALAPPLWGLVKRDVMARFFGAGMLLSLVPICATFPHERLLLFVGLGAMGLVALFLRDNLFAASATRPSETASPTAAPTRYARATAWFLVVVHGVLGPLSLPAATWGMAFGGRKAQHLFDGIAADESVRTTDLIVVGTPIPYLAHYLPIVRASNDTPAPAHVRVLASNVTAVEIARPDDRTLIVRPAGGYLQAPLDSLFRGPSRPMHVGQRVTLTGMTVEVMNVLPDGRPEEAKFQFDGRLEEEPRRWMIYEDGEMRPFVLPPVGGARTLARQEVWR